MVNQLDQPVNPSISTDNSHYYLEQLFDKMGIAFYSLDKDYRITNLNQVFIKWMEKQTNKTFKIGDQILYEGADKLQVQSYHHFFEKAFKGEFFEEVQVIGKHTFHVGITPIYVKGLIDGIAVIHVNKSKENDLHKSVLTLTNKVETILKSTSEINYTLDTNLNYRSYNESYRAIYHSIFDRYPELGQQPRNIFKISILNEDLQRLYHEVLSGNERTLELHLQDKVFEVLMKTTKDHVGKITGISVFGKNISYIKNSEKILKDTEERYKYVVDHVTDVVFQTDASGNWTYLNKAWDTIMEYDPEECINTLFFTYLHPDDVERNQQLFLPLINRQKNYCSHEIRYITKSGKIKWIKVFATLLLDLSDQIIGTTGTLKDITAEKENNYRYELLSKNSSDLITIHDSTGKFLFASDSARTLFGFAPEYLIGKDGFDFVHPEDRQKFIQQQGHMSKETVDLDFRFEFRHLTAKGSYVWVESTTKTFFDPFYGSIIATSTTRNINDRKLVEEQMIKALETEKQLNDLKSTFVSMASHEFRTPMTSIKSGAELAQLYLKDLSSDKVIKARNQIEKIDHEVDRLTELINNILLLSKIESNSLNLNKEETDLFLTIGFVVNRQEGFQKDGRKVDLHIDGINRKIHMDNLHMTHIIDNLVSNAFKYSQGHPNPVLRLNFTEKYYELKVQDFGIGIPTQDHQEIFKSFFRARNAGNIQGTGLGLVLVKHFVTMHGGTIEFESVAGSGTIFTVRIPYQTVEEVN